MVRGGGPTRPREEVAVSVKKKNSRKKVARGAVRKKRSARTPDLQHLDTPHLCLLRAPSVAVPPRPMRREITVATYNVHRWTGLNGRGASVVLTHCHHFAGVTSSRYSASNWSTMTRQG